MAYRFSEIFIDSSFIPFFKFLKTHKIYFLSIFVTLAIFYGNFSNYITLSDEISAYNDIKNTPKYNYFNFLQGPIFQIHILFQVFLYPNFPVFRLVYTLIHFFNILFFIYLFSRFININVLKIFGVFIVSHSLISESLLWVSASYSVIQALLILSIFFLATKYKDTNKLHYLLLIYFISLPVLIDNKSQALPLILIIFCTFILKTRLKKVIFLYGPLFLFSFLYVYLQSFRIQERLELMHNSAQNAYNSLDFVTPFISLARSFELLLFPINLTFMYLENFNQLQVYFYLALSILILVLFGLFFIFFRYIFSFLVIGLLVCLYMFSPIDISWYLANRYLYFFTFMGVLSFSMFLYYLINKNLKIGILFTISYLFFHSFVLNMKIHDWTEGSKLFTENSRIVGNNNQRLSIYTAQFLTLENKLTKGEEVFDSILDKNSDLKLDADFWKYYLLNLMLQGKFAKASERLEIYENYSQFEEIEKFKIATSIVLSRISMEYNFEAKVRYEAHIKNIDQRHIDEIIDFYYSYFKSVI